MNDFAIAPRLYAVADVIRAGNGGCICDTLIDYVLCVSCSIYNFQAAPEDRRTRVSRPLESSASVIKLPERTSRFQIAVNCRYGRPFYEISHAQRLGVGEKGAMGPGRRSTSVVAFICGQGRTEKKTRSVAWRL